MKIVDKLKSVVLSLWLGAALFFSAVVAPSVFSVLHSFDLVNANEIAGTIVTRTLAVINLGGFIIGLILLATVFILKRDAGRISLALEVLALALLAGTTAAGHWMVAARMLTLRTAMGIPIDQVAVNDPRRVAFNNLHHYSVALLTLAMIAAIISLIVAVRRPR